MRGVVKAVHADKGFGFIRGGDGEDYFFHATNVTAPLLIDGFARGDEVEFDPTKNTKGLRADGVHKTTPSE